MMEKLKPCPHCGGTDLQIVETDMTCCIRCCTKGCWLEGPTKEWKASAIEAWNALPCPMHWTKEPPTEPGWYFFRGNIPGYHENNPPVYVDVHQNKVVLVRRASWVLSNLIIKYDIEWAGPIQEPVE